jgi:inhibitor of cysteine peptidase
MSLFSQGGITWTYRNTRQTIYPLSIGAWVLCAALGLVFLPLSGCWASDDGAGSSGGGKGTPVLTLTQTDNGKSLTVGRGEKIVLHLHENPTTGFRWALEQADDEIVELVESNYSPRSGSGAGGGGQHSWTFTAQKVGSARIGLKLWRAWEGDKSIIERFTVTIRVTG